MEENCIDALRRMGPPEAYDAMLERAGKRDRPAIEVLGKIGDERAVDTLVDFIQDESNPPLQKTTLRALGEIGSEAATQDVANRLVAEDPEVRSVAARALGMIGDTRAVDPLANRITEDEDDSVRAAAAWALNQIGTEDALESAAAYADDRSFLVQDEAERAAAALGKGKQTA
jgi:HEAT repeat protein